MQRPLLYMKGSRKMLIRLIHFLAAGGYTHWRNFQALGQETGQQQFEIQKERLLGYSFLVNLYCERK